MKLIKVMISIGILVSFSSASLARNLITKTAQVVHVEHHYCMDVHFALSHLGPTDCPFGEVPSTPNYVSFNYLYLVLKIDKSIYGYVLYNGIEDDSGNVGANPPTYQWGFTPYGRFVSNLIAAKAANAPIEVVLDEAKFNALGAPGSDGFGGNSSIRKITVGPVVQKLTVCWKTAPNNLKCTPYDDPGVPSND